MGGGDVLDEVAVYLLKGMLGMHDTSLWHHLLMVHGLSRLQRHSLGQRLPNVSIADC